MLRSALLLSVLVLGAAPAAAATYSAKLAVPSSEKLIARDISWRCGADACQGATEDSRPLVLCQGLAKRAGKVASFLVDGRAFTSAELDRCNAVAKVRPTSSPAAQ